jgi:hypothetical protein
MPDLPAASWRGLSFVQKKTLHDESRSVELGG